MIARILFALERQKTRQQLKKLLSRPDVIVEFPSSRANLWERIGRETCDLVVVGRSLIPEPTADSLSRYKSLMDAPALVVLIDREDPEEHARLTSEGCDAVLSAGLPPAELAESLASILERQLELSRKTISLKRVVQQPRLKDFVSNSVIMKEFMDLVQRVVDSKSSLLVLGEKARVRYYATAHEDYAGQNDEVVQVYAVTYDDGGQTKTFFVALEMERIELESGEANWLLASTKHDLVPKGLREGPNRTTRAASQ